MPSFANQLLFQSLKLDGKKERVTIHISVNVGDSFSFHLRYNISTDDYDRYTTDSDDNNKNVEWVSAIIANLLLS